MKNSGLVIETVRRVLNYNPITGIFIWQEPISRRVAIGQEAGALSPNGRSYVGLLGEKVSSQRLAWFYVHGVWPKGNIVPLNGDYADARIANLKEESVADTARKGGLRSTNTSGLPGVSWQKQKSKWQATITRDYRRIHLGYFDAAEDASAAYQAALVDLPNNKVGAKVRGSDEIARRRRLWALWRKILKELGGTAWLSFEDFAAQLGSVPSAGHKLVRRDDSLVIGPDNFVWIEPVVTSAAQRARAHRQANPAQYRNKQLQKDFDITLVDYQRMFVEQKGVCAICARAETEERGGNVKWLAVDHDHATGEVRALLCHACNKAIGLMGDSVEYLTSAITYLKRFSKSADVAANVVPLKKESS